jgi:oligoendopeptidase F
MSVIDVQDVAWNLEPLVDGEGTAGAERMLTQADERAAAFA